MTVSGKIYLVVGIALTVLNLLILREVCALDNRTICEEWQFVESISAFAYLCGAVITFFQSLRAKGLEKKLTWLFSLTCLLCFVREVDLEYLNIPEVLIYLGSGSGRDVLFVSLYLAAILSIALSAKVRQEIEVGTIFRSQVMIVAAVGGVLLVLGSLFEPFGHTAAEEILEMNGSLLFLLAALLHEKIPLSRVQEIHSEEHPGIT